MTDLDRSIHPPARPPARPPAKDTTHDDVLVVVERRLLTP